MTKASTISQAISQRLELIKPANGFATEVAAVYGFGQSKPDKAPLPFLLARIASDERENASGNALLRAVSYQIEGVLPRSASLQQLQELHHDIIKTIGADPLPGVRLLESGWMFEDSAEFDPDNDGSTYRTVVVTLIIRYVETY